MGKTIAHRYPSCARAPKTVSEKDFYLVLERLRDVRKWAVERDIDPWAFRQAMITV